MERKRLLSARGITKQYPGTLALDRIDLDIYAGEVLGLIGENGAGKSTLMKILIGAETASGGTMEAHGQKYAPRNPIEAGRMGVGMVFQEQSLILNLTVAQNIFIGEEKPFVKHGLVDRARMNQSARKVLDAMEMQGIAPGARVNRLDFASRQMVEIAKVFHAVSSCQAEGTVILLDEPTSVLSEAEIRQLFRHIRRLCEGGNAVLFVSHKLDEVMAISDRICVFKDGCKAAEMPNDNVSESQLYQLMVGRTASGEYYQVQRQRTPDAEVVLELKSLCQRGFFGDIDLALHRGEIIGICGVVGSGKEDLCAVVCGDRNPTDGRMVVRGKARAFRGPHEALRSGILSVPRERRVEGIISEMPVFENICLSNYRAVRRHRLISTRMAKEQARRFVAELSIKVAGVSQLLGHLSGGNAQKVVFARVLASDADILLLDHPTRGVDVGAKAEIYGIIRDIVDRGKSVILLADTLDEAIGLSNRIVVMKDGLVTRVLEAPSGHKPEQLDIVQHMM
ncbi:MAG: sugar ABC transporter ATP-binding protein [Clostridiales bacterium]|nr:sugar ABC transporter ATP-binding protein [Clostridiales bacterium]